MTVDASILSPALEHLKEGAFGVRIRERAGEVLIERTDPVLGVDEVAEWIGLTPATIRQMAAKGLLHPIKSKGVSGSMRFRKSRLVADFKKLEG